MEDKKVLEVLDIYDHAFRTAGFPEVKHPHNQLFLYKDDVLAHCRSMLNGIKEFISLGNKEKRDRALIRLGFVQGCLAATGFYTVNDLKEHNRPDEQAANADPAHEPLTREDLDDWEY